ncbi:MAG: hypothetical protein N2578_07320, partial [Bdellovibrionaceae bacterium]|nr:hypothetical protein [Pseudobdellovibrionaceae bacterium]
MKRLVMIMSLGPMALLLMGNKGCEDKKQPPKARELKKIVEVSRLVSPAIELPDGKKFDFQFVANQQLVGVLAESDGFTFRYQPPIIPSRSSEQEFNMTTSDREAFKSMSEKAGHSSYARFSKEATCMINLPMARIGGSINSFEMIGGGGLALGFTPNGPHPVGFLGGVDFNVEFAQLDLTMMALRPLTNSVISAVNVNSKQTKTKVSFTLNLGQFALGPRFYYQTPLAAVTKKGLTTGVSQLKSEMEKEPWYSRVLVDHDTHIIVIGGRDVGLEVGDQLAVY